MESEISLMLDQVLSRSFVGSEVKCFEHSGRFVVGYVSINEITAVNSVYR